MRIYGIVDCKLRKEMKLAQFAAIVLFLLPLSTVQSRAADISVDVKNPSPSTKIPTESTAPYSYEDPDNKEATPPSGRPKPLHFTDMRPAWGVEAATSFGAFGQNALTPAQGGYNVYGFSVQVEYQPQFMQKYGILGIGPSVAAYPIFGANITGGFFSLWSAGAQIKYQARYFKNQPFVPVFGYAFEYLHYNYLKDGSGSAFGSGPMAGLWFLLNILEPSSAKDFFISQGIQRTYLIFEGRSMTGADTSTTGVGVSFHGFSAYAGVRVEF